VAEKTDGRPRYQQIAADLRAAIMLGDLPVGGKLPSVRQLESQFSTTSRTIQEALAVLRAEGHIESKHGQGIFVLARQPHAVDVAAYVVPTATGYQYNIMDVREVVPPADVATAFGLDEGEKALLRKRLTTLGGKPLEVDRSYYPLAIVAGTELAGRKRVKGGAPRVLAEAGHPQRYFVDRVSTRPPTTEELELLGIPQTVPIIQQLRIIYTDHDRPVEVSVLAKPGNLYELRYQTTI
jgi:GntR family transcriptional regulator